MQFYLQWVAQELAFELEVMATNLAKTWENR